MGNTHASQIIGEVHITFAGDFFAGAVVGSAVFGAGGAAVFVAT